MLDTRFPRIRGDVGNPQTWSFPVRYGVVAGATAQAVVCDDVAPFVDAFIGAGRELIAEGCTGIATTCGFLSLIRPRLARELGVPVAASALEQYGQIAASLPPDRRVGVLTISESSLTPAHLAAAGVPKGVVVRGMDGTAFARTILEDREDLDVEAARADMVTRAMSLQEAEPALGAIILECTNMVPYAADVARATRLPVYSIYTYLRWFEAGLVPRGF